MTTPDTVTVNIENVARKIARDPVGLSGVGAPEVVGLAQYALEIGQQPRLTASLAAAIAAVLERRCTLAAPHHLYAELGDAEQAFEDALNTLQTLFEQEFPK